MRAHWYLIVLITLMTAMVGCSRKQSASAPEPESLADAADSARIAIWQPEEAQGDTVHHSAFYDSVLAYVRKSTMIERDKREYGARLATLTPLVVSHLRSPSYRRMAIDSLTRYPAHDSDWRAAVGQVFTQYSTFAHRYLDTLYRDTLRFSRALPDIVRPGLFYPQWRPGYDSVEALIVSRTLDVLRLIDTNSSTISFKEDVRFADQDQSDAYDSLRADLDGLKDAEAKLSREAH